VQIKELDNFIKVLSDRDTDGAEVISVNIVDNYLEHLNVSFITH